MEKVYSRKPQISLVTVLTYFLFLCAFVSWPDFWESTQPGPPVFVTSSQDVSSG